MKKKIEVIDWIINQQKMKFLNKLKENKDVRQMDDGIKFKR